MENQKAKDEEKSKEKRKLSHPDKSLDSDYRPTRYGSTDYDRDEDEKGEEKTM